MEEKKSWIGNYIGEALGVFLIVLFGCGVVAVAVLVGGMGDLWSIGATWGLTWGGRVGGRVYVRRALQPLGDDRAGDPARLPVETGPPVHHRADHGRFFGRSRAVDAVQRLDCEQAGNAGSCPRSTWQSAPFR